MRLCSVDGCGNKLLATGLCNRHYKIKAKYGSEHHPIKRPLRARGEGAVTNAGYVLSTQGKRRQLEHILTAEHALGRRLPKGAVVHHFDGNPLNNSHDNLVVCPDQAYHFLLHVRQRAYDACGNANFRKCMNCGMWDDPRNMKWVRSTTYYHKPASLCKGV